MTENRFPLEILNVTKEEDQIIKKYYKDYIRPFVRVGPSGYLSTAGYADHAADIFNLEARPDDLWVVSFSRSGTTWLQELVWLIANNMDFEGVSVPLTKRFAYIEYPTQASEISKQPSSTSKRATEEDFRTLPHLPSPRYVKTHLPLSVLPPKLLETSKVFYVARDPRDIAVSFYFMHKLFRYFEEGVTFKEFWELFKKDLTFLSKIDNATNITWEPQNVAVILLALVYTYFTKSVALDEFKELFIKDLVLHMPIFAHIKETWEKRSHPNLMFFFYEDMQKDLLSVIDKVCSFLNREYSAEQKQELARYLTFENMEKNAQFNISQDDQSENKFIRKGKSGNWVNYFDENMKKEAEEYFEEHLKNTDMRFPNVN